MFNCAIISPPSIISARVARMVGDGTRRLLNHRRAGRLVSRIGRDCPVLIRRIAPGPLSIKRIRGILTGLLERGISVQGLPIVFRALTSFTGSADSASLLARCTHRTLTERVAGRFSRRNSSVGIMALSKGIRGLITRNIRRARRNGCLSVSPAMSRGVLRSVTSRIRRLSLVRRAPVILYSPTIEVCIERLARECFPRVPVLSCGRLRTGTRIRDIKIIGVS